MFILRTIISEEVSLKKHTKTSIAKSHTLSLHISISHLDAILFYARLQLREHVLCHKSKNKLKNSAAKLCIKHIIKVRNRHLTV